MKKLLYSKRTEPNRGYSRAIYLMKEFNSYIKNLNLVSISIDKIMEEEYIVNKNSKVSNFFKKQKNNISCYIYRKTTLYREALPFTFLSVDIGPF